jgi:hypothetical protein
MSIVQNKIILLIFHHRKLYIVTDLINALPGNSSVDAVQHAVFSVSALMSHNVSGGHMTYVSDPLLN